MEATKSVSCRIAYEDSNEVFYLVCHDSKIVIGLSEVKGEYTFKIEGKASLFFDAKRDMIINDRIAELISTKKAKEWRA